MKIHINNQTSLNMIQVTELIKPYMVERDGVLEIVVGDYFIVRIGRLWERYTRFIVREMK